MRAHHVHIEHDFAKPPERIFAHLAEHENLAELFGAKVTRLRDGEDGERNGVGSVRRLHRAAAAVRGDRHRLAPSERIVYRITKGSPLRGHVGVMSFARASGGTRFVYDIRLASPVPGLALLVRTVLTRSITQALPNVERDAEAAGRRPDAPGRSPRASPRGPIVLARVRAILLGPAARDEAVLRFPYDDGCDSSCARFRGAVGTLRSARGGTARPRPGGGAGPAVQGATHEPDVSPESTARSRAGARGAAARSASSTWRAPMRTGG